MNHSAFFFSSRAFSGCTSAIYMVQCYSISEMQSLLQVVTQQGEYDLRRTGDQMKEPENNAIQLFEDQKIRVAWDAEREEWYFSVVDVVGVLTDSPDYNTGRKYWNKLKQRLKEEGSELVTNCHQLKMRRSCRRKRRSQMGNEAKSSYREILGNYRRWAAYISDFDREMAKYLKGGEPN